MKKKANYIDNEQFLKEMIKYKDALNKAKENDEELPRVPRYIGDCIQKIAYNLARAKNFSNYPFKEEMIFDGIENCLRYIGNFDYNKLDRNGKPVKPFGYFTKIIYYAFLRRIAKEKKYLYMKYKYAEQNGIFLDSELPAKKMTDFEKDHVSHFIENFETNEKNKKRKSKNSTPTDVLLKG